MLPAVAGHPKRCAYLGAVAAGVSSFGMNRFKLNQMFKEAQLRYADGDFLSNVRHSDSGYLLKLLGFELILKSALYADKQVENQTHNYYAMYCTLSRDLKNRINSEAQRISHIFDISSRIQSLLNWYEYNFVRLRYPFQSYAALSEAEYQEYRDLYVALGCPEGEAEFEYYPEELRGLYLALEGYVQESC